jgi:putative toxin-antitoxin system antitoxin component (TIGR02293 family)
MATLKEPMVPIRRAPRPAPRALDALAALDGARAVAAVKQGLDAGLLRQLADKLDLSLEDLTHPLRLAPRTLHRRIERGRLSLDESERLLVLAKILRRAGEIFGSHEKAAHWLKSPVAALGGQSPLSCAETQIGLRQVETILTRIADVVYS